MPTPGEIHDGYELIRPIGQGGFGEVWLAKSRTTGGFHALKFISSGADSALSKELEAVIRYREAAASIRSLHLMPIEHANRYAYGLFYAMPLADGIGADEPENPEWKPLTLATLIERGLSADRWYSAEEIKAVMSPIMEGLHQLSKAGLVHRDIKPDNVLFFKGVPCIGDVSLLTNDRTQITRHGTPGYLTPSWYVGGHHDMYGAAAMLYSLLTGNEPDRMGRAAFIWPPQGAAQLTPEDRKEWARLHAVIRRATDEKPGERYPDFAAMASAIRGEDASRDVHFAVRKKSDLRSAIALSIGLIFALVGVTAWHFHFNRSNLPTTSSQSPTVRHTPEPEQRGESFAALLEKDAQNTALFREKWMTQVREISEGIKGVDDMILKTTKIPAESAAFRSGIIGIRDTLRVLNTAHPKTGIELYNEATDVARGIEKIASNIPTTADEEFAFKRTILPQFAEHAQGGSRLARVSSEPRLMKESPATSLQSTIPNGLSRLAGLVQKAKGAEALDEKQESELITMLVECRTLLIELHQKAVGI